MTRLRLPALMALSSLLAVSVATAQAPDTTALPLSAAEERSWAFSASAYTYLLADDPDFVQPTVTADRGALHLEGRYNYEAIHAASAWTGYNLSAQGALTLEFTPIVGGVFGSMTGVGLGYEGSLGWKGLELHSEGEYIIDTEDSSGNFFYNWSQLSFAPTEWAFFGLLTQRTRLYDTDREIQRGPLVGFTQKSLTLTGFLLNPDDADPTVIVALEVEF